MKQLLFVRDYHGMTGGHLKVLDYIGHARISGVLEPLLYLTPQSLPGNPFESCGCERVDTPVQADAFFVGGLDWEILDAHGVRTDGWPVVNLVQHMRHAMPADPRYRFLPRPALRCCVSRQVKAAVDASGRACGPVVVVENGIDLDAVTGLRHLPKASDVFIGALKNPGVGEQVRKVLDARGWTVMLRDVPAPRGEFLRSIASARVALLLPHPEEGFFLPALEAMALGTPLVVTDCHGNRSFCRDRDTCLVPAYTVQDLAGAVEMMLREPRLAQALAAAGLAESARFTLDNERKAFFAHLQPYLAAFG